MSSGNGLFKGFWARNTTYFVNDFVVDSSNNMLYQCKSADSDSSTAPSGNSTNWGLMGPGRSKYRGTYARANAYQIDDIVLDAVSASDKRFYRAKATVAANRVGDPHDDSSETVWEQVGGGGSGGGGRGAQGAQGQGRIFLYEDVAQGANAPARPTFTSYNVSTGEILGETSGWTLTPPTSVTTGTRDYYYVPIDINPAMAQSNLITPSRGATIGAPTQYDGIAGPAGSPGQGVASGGSTGQVLQKTNNNNYATSWRTIFDKYKGDWVADTTYSSGDVVWHSNNLYRCHTGIAGHGNNENPAADTDNTNWRLAHSTGSGGGNSGTTDAIRRLFSQSFNVTNADNAVANSSATITESTVGDEDVLKFIQYTTGGLKVGEVEVNGADWKSGSEDSAGDDMSQASNRITSFVNAYGNICYIGKTNGGGVLYSSSSTGSSGDASNLVCFHYKGDVTGGSGGGGGSGERSQFRGDWAAAAYQSGDWVYNGTDDKFYEARRTIASSVTTNPSSDSTNWTVKDVAGGITAASNQTISGNWNHTGNLQKDGVNVAVVKDWTEITVPTGSTVSGTFQHTLTLPSGTTAGDITDIMLEGYTGNPVVGTAGRALNEYGIVNLGMEPFIVQSASTTWRGGVFGTAGPHGLMLEVQYVVASATSIKVRVRDMEGATDISVSAGARVSRVWIR